MTSTKTPYIIAGPCSVESREQLSTIVASLSQMPQVKMIRCGVWKPRTRPGGFEGLGEPALQWISELKKEYPNTKFCCEVASTTHVELALQYGIDALWVGARTAGNPFSMTELTESLKGCDLPIMIKNPMTPDANAWIGAIERCQHVGLTHVAAIHRGFDVYNNMGYRNNPLWEVPIELHRRMPELPIICDPSHISGRSDWVAKLSQTALDFNFDGLMIEVHNQPQNALTDAQQQITPKELETLLNNLVMRQEGDSTNNDLVILREKIDLIDDDLMKLLEQRIDLVREIAKIKARQNMTIVQPKRWEEKVKNQMEHAQKLGISKDFIKELFEKIHAESVRIQETLINK